ncbi:MAG: hypothetical protein EOP43_04020 [Sphingobacteriaceae bacterium]|nr:MAG: hypothetical protein EOP43_04020 [Sphingobacteriaceae bacterium]
MQFLREAFSTPIPQVYYNQLHNFDFKQIKEVLSKDTIYSSFSQGQQKSDKQLILTELEKKVINKEIDSQIDFKWEANLFEGSKMIEKDRTTFADVMKMNTSIYSFSKPIFIRNDSICIVYNQYTCGIECGQGTINIYRKVNNKWMEWIFLIQWIS